MKIFIPKPNWQSPEMCASCGSSLSEQYIPKVVSVASTQDGNRAKTKLPYLLCAECSTFLKEMKRSFRPQVRKAFAIGFSIVVLLALTLVGILFALSQNRQTFFSTLSTGILLAQIVSIALLGGVLGWAAAKLTEYTLLRSKKLPKEARQRIQRILKPIEVDDYASYEEPGSAISIGDQKFFGYIVLSAVNEPFAKEMINLNNGESLTLYCAQCGDEIAEEKSILASRGWAAALCTDCKSLFCPKCLGSAKNTPCPSCGKPTGRAKKKEVLATGLYSEFASQVHLGERKKS